MSLWRIFIREISHRKINFGSKLRGTAMSTKNIGRCLRARRISCMKGFCRWCTDAKRLDENPCEHVKRVDQTGDRRRVRRALWYEECVRLLAVAGPRELIYRLALGTGLRKREIRRLQWRDLQIEDSDRPCIALRPEATKSKRADTLPLSSDLAARLRAARPAD